MSRKLRTVGRRIGALLGVAGVWLLSGCDQTDAPRSRADGRSSLSLESTANAAPPIKPSASSANAGGASAAAPVHDPAGYAAHVRPFVEKNCLGCHKAGKKTAGIALDGFPDAASVLASNKSRKLWNLVLENVKAGAMPPPERPRPDSAQLEKTVAWLEAALTTADCKLNPNPGRVTIRRLNKVEYNNTVGDLLGLANYRGADNFPSDDVGYGFDNIGDVLSLSPLLLEMYLEAARQAAEEAIISPEPPKPSKQVKRGHPNEIRLAGVRRGGPPPPPDKPLIGHFSLELHGGEYEIRVRSIAVKADDKKPATLSVQVADMTEDRPPPPDKFRVLKKFDLENPPAAAPPLGAPPPKKFGGRPAVEYKFKTRLPTGRYYFALEFAGVKTDHTLRLDGNQVPATPVDFVEIDGPYEPDPMSVPEHTKKLLSSKAKPGSRDAAREVLQRLASRAYRRPVTGDDVNRVLAVYDAAEKLGESYEGRLRAAVQAVLISPNFLFRVELDSGAATAKAALISEWELASRLSYFLWCSMPDEELFAQANAGTLRKNLDAQVRRMLASPKAAALTDNFAAQWLQIRNLSQISPDPKLFPKFNDRLREAMRTETLMFFGEIADKDRSVLDLLEANFTYVNGALAELYGIGGVRGDKFVRVTLPSDGRRGGLLTQASILTITSNPTRTSPVKRGKWILEQILGTPPPPPPPNVPELKDDHKTEEAATLRQRMEQHRKDPSCASCHNRMDAMGFAFENYNAIGAWRDKDGKFDIDPAGVLPDGRKFAGPAELKTLLKQKKELFGRNLAEKLLTFAIGRGLESYDRCAVNDAVANLERDQWKFSALVLAVVKSDPFQKRGRDRPESE